MSGSLTAAARLAPGNGLVVRRATALLYTPARDVALVEAFAASAPGTELQAVASTTVAAGFAVGPFVCLAWSAGVQVMAFGDLAVETDQPSLPMLTGAGSRTWVEHSFAPNGSAVIEVIGDAGDVDGATDLGAGVALAGGFRVELATAGADRDPAPVEAVVASVEVAEAEAGEGATAAIPRLADPAPAPPPEPPVGPPAQRPVPPAAVDPDDPIAALAAIQAAAVGADGEPLPPAGASAPAREAPQPPPADVVEPDDADITLPPPVSDALLEGVGAIDAGDARGSLIDAKRCGNGHLNPPTAATCAVCGEFLAPGSSSVVHVPRPSLGELQLDDGELVELDHELLIGRNPDRDSDPERRGLRRVKLLGEKVSRSHLEIRFQGWEVLVADCGSTNGTFVVPHPGGQVVTLAPGRPQMIEPGATVYFGSRSFTVLGRQVANVSLDLRLRIDFIGEETVVDLGDELTFGRQGDLHIDDNRHLHRVLGRFWSRNDAWWLTNEGRSITIQIADADSRSNVMLAPGSEIGLSFPNSILRFRAGVTDYEIVVRVPDREAEDADDDSRDDPLEAEDTDDGGDTIALGDLMLADEQRLLLLALAEGTLRDPHGNEELPTNRAVARRLGWSITKFNRKLDNLCERFSKLGVGGLRGSIDQLATDRRRRLVEHAVESGLIDRTQLALLPAEAD